MSGWEAAGHVSGHSYSHLWLAGTILDRADREWPAVHTRRPSAGPEEGRGAWRWADRRQGVSSEGRWVSAAGSVPAPSPRPLRLAPMSSPPPGSAPHSMSRSFGESYRVGSTSGAHAITAFCSWDHKVTQKWASRLQHDKIRTHLKVSRPGPSCRPPLPWPPVRWEPNGQRGLGSLPGPLRESQYPLVPSGIRPQGLQLAPPPAGHVAPGSDCYSPAASE